MQQTDDTEPASRAGAAERVSAFRFKRVLLAILIGFGVINAAGVAILLSGAGANQNGFLMNGPSPFGHDFVNLWTVGKLILSGNFSAIYDPEAFMSIQKQFLGVDTGYRLWAYPPHSLLFAWPFEAFSYLVAFLVFSACGQILLTVGARRLGFDWMETAVLVTSPASLACVYYGQTGNIAAGLLMVAISPRQRSGGGSMLSAAFLTIKPQVGFLLPLLWIRQKQRGLITGAALLSLALIGLSVFIFGASVWRDYFSLTTPALSEFERVDIGPFMRMIPSLFMSLRLVGMDGDSALLIHAAFALAIGIALIWRLFRTADRQRQVTLLLIATCLMTPYMHMYDLTLLVVAGLLMIRSTGPSQRDGIDAASATLLFCWLAPYLVYVLAVSNLPIMPLLMGAIFVLV